MLPDNDTLSRQEVRAAQVVLEQVAEWFSAQDGTTQAAALNEAVELLDTWLFDHPGPVPS